MNNQKTLGNNFERAVIDNKEPIPPRETTRYEFAKNNMTGKKVLEIGCSSGYGLRILGDVDYTGVDYDKDIIEFAKQNFKGKFIHADINEFELGQYDTIIAFEILEHLDNGKELAQRLKKHCKTLICSVPYNEDKGFWGVHHKLHGLTTFDFPEFEYEYIALDGTLGRKEVNGLMLMKWEKGKEYKKEHHVLAEICTKDRYFSTLPMTIMSVATQTRVPEELIIIDDGECKDLRDNEMYQKMFAILTAKGIKWQVIFGSKKGQHYSHQMAQDMARDLVWRIDDDEYAESTVLETLLSNMTDEVGAVGGLVITPPYRPLPDGLSNKIDDDFPNIQWCYWKGKKEVDHLYSSFLYRKGIADYNLMLSPVAHTEETQLSYEIKRKGWKVIVDAGALTWHIRNPEGGIRTQTNAKYWEDDEKYYLQKKKDWKGKKLIVLNNGLGDHIVFSKLLPEIKEEVEIACCYPEVFKGYKVISIEEVKKRVNIDYYNVYKYMWDLDWKDSLENAFRKMYDINPPIRKETTK